MLALYLRHGGSPDVLKDKFHTAPDKLTRFRLCCRLGGRRKPSGSAGSRRRRRLPVRRRAEA